MRGSMTIDLSETMEANFMFLHKFPFVSFSLYNLRDHFCVGNY